MIDRTRTVCPLPKQKSIDWLLYRPLLLVATIFFLEPILLPILPTDTKEAFCGCAGVFPAHAAVELYAKVFDKVGRLSRLEGFVVCTELRIMGYPATRLLSRWKRKVGRYQRRLTLGMDYYGDTFT
jgi:hypothetical protein